MTHADVENFRNTVSALPRSTTVFREAGLRTLLLHLKPGENIPEHQTRGAILVHCLAGRGRFSIGEEQTEVRSGILISVPPSAPHSVTAAPDEELLLLLTVSEALPAAE